jgi:hypothetical protein
MMNDDVMRDANTRHERGGDDERRATRGMYLCTTYS